MDKRLKQIIVAFTVLGLLVSIYMTIFKITNNAKMCVGSHGCSIVNASGYSEVNGIPVAVIGVLGYLSILAVLYFENRLPFLGRTAVRLSMPAVIQKLTASRWRSL